MHRIIIFLILSISIINTYSQSSDYKKEKERKISEGSVFTKIINRELPAKIVYEDDDIISFVPNRLQTPTHLLIVPKKEIYTINDITEADTNVLGKLFLVAKKLAKEYGVSESGYRLTINVNEDSGQSVFHIHMHLLAGKKLGNMTSSKENKN